MIPVLVLLTGAAAWHYAPKRAAAAAPAAPSGVPVARAAVTERDMPIWLSGLGTVQAYNTVTVRPRVSGSLDKVNFTEGQQVNTGDVLARIDSRSYQSILDQALAKKAQNEALLANARQDFDRTRSLVGGGAVSRTVLDQKQSALDQALAIAQSDIAAVAAAQLDLDFTTVRAPIAGRTGIRLIDEGNLVTASQATALVVITQLQPISVILTISQDHLPALQKRMQSDHSPLIIQALTDDGKVLAEGKLELIDNQIDTSTGNLRLKAAFENKDTTLWPGQFVSARVLVETRPHAIVVPTEVVQLGLNGPFAYVIKKDGTVEARDVKPGPEVDGLTVIESGLKPGEQVVRDGQSKLQPGARVADEPHSAS